MDTTGSAPDPSVAPVPDEPGVPRDPSSITTVMADLADDGFTATLVARPGGAIECPACGTTSDAADFAVEHFRRLEGASDPDDMLAIAALRCPRCETGGALVLTYGPQVTEADGAVLERLGDPPPPQPEDLEHEIADEQADQRDAAAHGGGSADSPRSG